MKKLIIIAVMFLSACGTVNVQEQANGMKVIAFTDPPYISFPREAAFAQSDVQLSMRTTAIKECPHGYSKINESYLKDNGQGKDALVWEIRCKGS